MAADFVPKARKEGFNILADLADTKIEYPFLSFNMMGAYLDRNMKMAKALIQRVGIDHRAANRFDHGEGGRARHS